MRLRWHEKASPAQVKAIAAQIDAAGFCRIDDFVGEEELRSLGSLAEAAVDKAGGEYVAFTGPQGFAGTVWDSLNSSPALHFLCENLYRHSTGTSDVKSGFHQVFRCLKGRSAKRHSLYFHFDSYIVTILVPVIIPDSDRPGRLILFPPTRPVRKAYWRNVIDKLFSDLWPVQRFYRMLAGSPRSKAVSMRLEPGSAVVFWGYRSLHTNDHPDPDKLRVTGLLHFGNPHHRAKPMSARVSSD
jgi:hypothetical protein